MTGIQVKLILTRLPDNAARMLTRLITCPGAKTHVDPLKGCVTCEENYRLKPVTPGYQDAVLIEVKTTKSPKSAAVYTLSRGAGVGVGGGRRHICAVAQKVQTET